MVLTKVLLELIKGLDKDAFEAHALTQRWCLSGVHWKRLGLGKSYRLSILRRKYFNPKGILEYFGSYNRYSKANC